jgi:metal-responsive CopG/Arc/MetJ family transcriptional regulator
MGKSTRDITKIPRKRAPEKGTPVLVRLQATILSEIDEWRRKQRDAPGRPEAIRQLVKLGLRQSRSK